MRTLAILLVLMAFGPVSADEIPVSWRTDMATYTAYAPHHWQVALATESLMVLSVDGTVKLGAFEFNARTGRTAAPGRANASALRFWWALSYVYALMPRGSLCPCCGQKKS